MFNLVFLIKTRSCFGIVLSVKMQNSVKHERVANETGLMNIIQSNLPLIYLDIQIFGSSKIKTLNIFEGITNQVRNSNFDSHGSYLKMFFPFCSIRNISNRKVLLFVYVTYCFRKLHEISICLLLYVSIRSTAQAILNNFFPF